MLRARVAAAAAELDRLRGAAAGASFSPLTRSALGGPLPAGGYALRRRDLATGAPEVAVLGDPIDVVVRR